MTVPIYNTPQDSNIGSPDSMPWSTAEDIIRDIVREGPFETGATPMDTEDSPLIITGMPGCPYRMTSYTGTALMDADAAYGLQLHQPPVSGVNWGSGVGEIIESLAIVLGEPLG